MFREGQYLEVIKASEGCLATAIVTIKEKTVEYKKKKITTNKWLDLQDWASLYGIIRKAIIRNNESRSQGKIETTERRKSTRHLEVTYKFEASECPEDRNSMPTIRVSVSAPRKSSGSASRRKIKDDLNKLKKYDKRMKDETNVAQRLSENESFMCDDYSLEEYVPPEITSSAKASVDLKYVPSRKSALMRMRSTADENKYTPTSRKEMSLASNDGNTEIRYIPNSISSLKKPIHERYDPCDALTMDLSATYVPSSKGVRNTVEEYQPDFATKTMKFDDSYVPSSAYPSSGDESRKRSRKSRDSTSIKSSTNRSHVSKVAKREL